MIETTTLFPEGLAMGDAFINPKTGALMDGEGGETDLLIVDLHDMPILDEFFVLNGDAPISQAA